jgi:hypothetical protein
MPGVLSITAQDLATQIRPVTGVGSVSVDEFGTILAQKSKTVASQMGVDVSTASSTISDTLGKVGQYGMTPTQLETAGYLKPGTVDRYLSSGTSSLSSVLNSSNVWTGKEGVNTVNTLLGNSELQTSIQTQAFNTSLNQLKSSNVISGLESSKVVGSITNVATEFGVDNTSAWLNNDIADAAMGLDMDMLARSGSLSTDFVASKANSLLSTDIATTVQNQLGSDLSGLANNSFSQLASSIGGISVVQGAAGQILGGAASALSSVMGNLSGVLGNLSGAFSGLFGSAGFSGGGAKVQAPRVITPQAVTQTINRSGIDNVMTSLIGNAKVAAPNYTGILNASAFQLPSLSGLTQAASNLTGGGPVTVCRCDGAPELLAPTQAECEAAGGTWVCTTINTTSGTLT